MQQTTVETKKISLSFQIVHVHCSLTDIDCSFSSYQYDTWDCIFICDEVMEELYTVFFHWSSDSQFQLEIGITAQNVAIRPNWLIIIWLWLYHYRNTKERWVYDSLTFLTLTTTHIHIKVNKFEVKR